MKTTVTYGVIKGLEVTLPDGECNATQLVRAFADAYVKHATTGAIVSDEVLVSSIGAAHVQHAMIGGCKRYGKAFQDAVRETAKSWRHFVLMARYGTREGTAKDLMADGMGEAEAMRLTEPLAKA